MKLSFLTTAAYGASVVRAHGYFHMMSINGVAQPSLEGMRVPGNNGPVTDVTLPDMVCGQTGGATTSPTVLDATAGDDVAVWFQHAMPAPAGDPDNPIAKSHKGPIMVYMAQVDDATTTTLTGLKWFKIWEDGVDMASKEWAVDRMIANDGWTNFTVPACLAPGQYLLRFELIALHTGMNPMGTQFYQSCAQFNIAGTGNLSPEGVDIPGTYGQSDPGILYNIHGGELQPYTIPGPAVVTCA